ncbi:MAG: hypothetical protein JNL30_10175 [Rubrivivax sp.]|nr:hypothetical protein [Rubrivivax sp.]
MPLLRRFDARRLHPIPTHAVSARRCPRTERLIAALHLGAGPANRHWAEVSGAVRIELPFACYQVDDLEIARRAALQLDGTWRMADASAGGRLVIRAQALWADVAWWRALQPADASDAGEAGHAAALAGFEPRRTTLVVVAGTPDDDGLRTLAELERQGFGWSRALRVLLVGAAAGTARHLPL